MDYLIPQSCYVGKLPVETLSQIFMLAAHGAPNESLQSVAMPHVLASVNLHWRTVALCNHSLWSSLVIDLQKVIRKQTSGGLTPLTTMITRSGRSSVDIIIRAQQGPMSGTEEMIRKTDFTKTMFEYADCMPAILNLLLPEVYRWRSLEIISDTWMPIYSALQLLNEPRTESSSALRLESIKLKRTNDFLSHYWLFCPGAMRMVEGNMFAALIGATNQDAPVQSPPLPKLRNITLYGVHLNWTNFFRYTLGATPNQSPTISNSIQVLELSHHSGEVRPTSDEFSGILAACPRLKKLVLGVSGPLTRLSGQVSLPQLQELHYGYGCIGYDVGLFSGLHAPNLIKLGLERRKLSGARATYSPTQDDGSDDKADNLLKYCTTHPLFPKLQELSLYNINVPVNTFALFFDTIPTLLHLLLHRTPNALPALLPIQKPSAGAGIPCPALESIRIFPNSHKDSLIVTLKGRRSAPRLADSEWLWEEMLEGGIIAFSPCSKVA
ncbi:uncharacterized protein F5147DRAFT_586599 [Suillus discolor]|uniref:F-box domain-containing protein n=1 Tax=Suillus discolor TaxID=1912936 RepID=A0A9P7ETU4_9AGAM|nr:uncharacterized protein F5147DRAFT_586599 [Suillus discolor]KAG2090762.1 hypothetical protein F5147DRAFT_586599 [Suillus discolor]